MNKKISFKDLLPVDYMPGQDELISYAAKKRKRELTTGDIGEDITDEIRKKLKEAQRLHLERYYKNK